MSGQSKLLDLVRTIAEAPVEACGLELVDVELVTENKKKILRLIINKRGGVTLDDCSAVSRIVDPLIDSHKEIRGHDYFEVSSPGLDRPLKTERDYARYQGEWVDVKLYQAQNGRKTYQGRLAPCSESEICLLMEDGTNYTFKRSQVAKMKRMIH